MPSPELREPLERGSVLEPGNVRRPRYTSGESAAMRRLVAANTKDPDCNLQSSWTDPVHRKPMQHDILDADAAHRHFAPECFNRAWELLSKPTRTPVENDEMLLVAMASLWHWSRREDCTPRNRAVGYWLVSRVQAVLGNGLEARRLAARSAMHASGEPAFYMAYAHEALARAGRVLKDEEAVQRHLAEARGLLAEVSDPEERQLLEADLATVEQPE